MSKEMTAEGYLEYQYVTTDITGDIKLTTVIAAKHYGDLRAKEAVKEFAEELMKFIQPLSTSQSITNYVNILLEQKGVKI